MPETNTQNKTMAQKQDLKQAWIDGRTMAISDMLDNPNEYGIYPTTKFFNSIDDLHERISKRRAIAFAHWVSIQKIDLTRTYADFWGELYEDWNKI